MHQGTELSIVVGQAGGYASRPPTSSTNEHGGSGGGGTFVYMHDPDTGLAVPLVVAGGGGGSSYFSSGMGYWGGAGLAGLDGGRAMPHGGPGGINGTGGRSSGYDRDDKGGGGGGWKTDGVAAYHVHTAGAGYHVFLGGFEMSPGYQEGGFGGGAGTKAEGAGGGGFSGGGGGSSALPQTHGGGGGGGSYAKGDYPKLETGANDISADGLVVLERPCAIGEVMDPEGKCQDVDACAYAPCPPGSTCTDLQGQPADARGRQCSCDPGFVSGPGDRCVDIDACIAAPCLPDPNDPAAVVCTDLPPPAPDGPVGRTCGCNAGYAPLVGGFCRDVDACLEAPCGSEHARCTDLPPPAPGSRAGRHCECAYPFQGDGDTCACPPGFVERDGTCEDVDACEVTPCSPHASCQDLRPPLGPESKGRVCTCLTPYLGDGETCACPSGTEAGAEGCVDTDACSTWPCSVHATCADLPLAVAGPAGRTCTCDAAAGFIGTGEPGGCECGPGLTRDGATCQNIDACATSPCAGELDFCVDRPPPAGGDAEGRDCTCAPGTALGSSGLCRPINACETTPCPDSALACFDFPAPAGPGADGRSCACDTGLAYDPNLNLCVDSDACFEGACGRNNECIDSLAPSDGFQCRCLPGHVLVDRAQPDGPCRAVDPCTSFPCRSPASPCPGGARCAVCLNRTDAAPDDRSGRACWCPDGYAASPDGVCRNVDACETSPCDPNAVCRDVAAPDILMAQAPPADGTGWAPQGGGPDGRSCVCGPNYRGNGELCVRDGAPPTPDPGPAGSSDGTDTTTVALIGALIATVVLVSVAAWAITRRRRASAPLSSPQSYENPAYSAHNRRAVDAAVEQPTYDTPPGAGGEVYVDTAAATRTQETYGGLPRVGGNADEPGEYLAVGDENLGI